MKKYPFIFACFMAVLLPLLLCACSSSSKETQIEFPTVSQFAKAGDFPLFDKGQSATICLSEDDYSVVSIAARMLADDVERVTCQKAEIAQVQSLDEVKNMSVVVGTIGHSRRGVADDL